MVGTLEFWPIIATHINCSWNESHLLDTADLGCVPGAWMQVACQELGPRERGGLVFGIDIQDIIIPTRFCDDRVQVLKADAREVQPMVFQEIAPSGFDAVLSDMLQFTTGAGNDVDLSIELASTALHIATGNSPLEDLSLVNVYSHV